jgi:bifunctional non-homologous end joining protein LigD
VQKECPFAKRPRTDTKATWVRPELVCEVAFADWTDDGRMRLPIFLGLREDKAVKDVRRELPKPIPDQTAPSTARSDRSSTSPPHDRTTSAPLDVPLTNLDKIYWPDEGYTKRDLIEYYRTMAPVILPYLLDRPQSLNRHPNGIKGQSFYQKDISKQSRPEWVDARTIFSEHDGREITYVVCRNEQTILFLANLGCIELNPWFSRIGTLDRPDYAVIDLDPTEALFEHVVEAAQMVRKVLDQAGAPCYCKTSGKRGLHCYIPLGAKYDYDQARQFGEIIANVVHARLPATTSVVRSPALRRGLVYLDFLQNRRGQTLAAPYSVRPWPGATVSTPLKWSEVRRGLDPGKYTIRTVPRRVDRLGDLWQPVLGPGIDLMQCLANLQQLLAR